MALDEPMTKRQARFLRVKTKQYDVVRNIMQRENSPHKNIAVYVRDILGCYREVQRDLRSANETLNLLDQLRRDDDHEDMALDEYVSTLFCKIKSIDSVVEQGRKAYDMERENTALKAEIAALRREVGNPSELDRVMEGSRPLRERYEDALEVVRKQAKQIEELEEKAIRPEHDYAELEWKLDHIDDDTVYD